MGSPLAEDHCRHGDEALTRNDRGGEQRNHSQRLSRAAEASEDAGNDNSRIPHRIDIDTQGIRGGGMLTHCPQTQAPLGTVEHEPDHTGEHQGDHKGDVHIEVAQGTLRLQAQQAWTW